MTRAYRLAEIAERFGGELLGNPDTCVNQVASLEKAGSTHISFLAQARFRRLLAASRAGAFILPYPERDSVKTPRILCDDPYLYFARVSMLFNPPVEVQPGIHTAAVIHPEAIISRDAQLAAGCYIGAGARIDAGALIGVGSIVGDHAHIGADTRLYARVTVYHGCQIGQRGLFHAGAVVGSDGFGIARTEGKWLKIPQIGSVRIEDDVEIGANTTIDRGALDDTVIEEGVKLDNQIQVGHNVRIGAHSAIAGCVGIAGSANIGRHCTIGGAAMILGHLSIADYVSISAGTLVTKSINKPGKYTGSFPLDDHQNWLRNAVHLRHLNAMADRISALEKKESSK
jgi:UDP-3-O-[3-hydroxymyristoyl] glucosamine N-acyltransferase